MQAFRFKNLAGAYKLSRGIHQEAKVMQSLHSVPGLTAKRLINCVGTRLREVDPERWESVPITWETKWTNSDGMCDIRTSIMVHDAIELEFGVDINDKRFLIQDFPGAWYILGNSEGGL